MRTGEAHSLKIQVDMSCHCVLPHCRPFRKFSLRQIDFYFQIKMTCRHTAWGEPEKSDSYYTERERVRETKRQRERKSETVRETQRERRRERGCSKKWKTWRFVSVVAISLKYHQTAAKIVLSPPDTPEKHKDNDFLILPKCSHSAYFIVFGKCYKNEGEERFR